MVDALGGFDPKETYDDASSDYEDASARYWRHLSVRTVERLGLRPGERVLDVPCGTGHALLSAAGRVGPSGRVVGLDLAEHMLDIARGKVRAEGLANVDLQAGDMTAIDPPEVPFDAVICVLGIFFVDDMAALVRSFHDLVRPNGGRVAVTVFGECFVDPLRQVFVKAVQQVAPGFDVVQPWQRTANPADLRGVFDDAGLGNVTIETDDDTFPLPSAEAWWGIVMGSGLRRTISALGAGRAGDVRDRCRAYIEGNGVDRVLTRSRYALVVRE